MLKTRTLNLHGFTIDEAMTRFVEQYNRTLAGGKGEALEALEVIHGKGRGGEGGLRQVLRDYLRGQGTRIKGFDARLAMQGAEYLLDVPGKLVYMHGEDAMDNAGCTIVVPRHRLSIEHDWVHYPYR
jgi:hypothetical protein